MGVTPKGKKAGAVNSAVLEEADLRHFDQDIRSMARKDLIRHFAADSSGRVLVTKLIKNIIWQAYERIQAGSAPTIQGNIRSFWYLWVKPVVGRVPNYSDAKTDPYV